jgi:hypothetical protein
MYVVVCMSVIADAILLTEFQEINNSVCLHFQLVANNGHVKLCPL